MFALFEGVSNEFLVSSFLPLPFSFMKTMIHTSALWTAGQWLLPRQPTSPAHLEKSPTVNRVHSAKLGENMCLAISHASLCACLDNTRVDFTFFSFLSETYI